MLTSSSSFITENNGNIRKYYANFLIIIYNGKQRKHTEITEILGGGSVLCFLKDFMTQTEKQPLFPLFPNDFCLISVMVNHSRTI